MHFDSQSATMTVQLCSLFFFNDTTPTEIYTLSLHDALPISGRGSARRCRRRSATSDFRSWCTPIGNPDRKSTRLNSSHTVISYAVFCLKKKKIYNPMNKFDNIDWFRKQSSCISDNLHMSRLI